eukprot:CAMPEP_0177225948 /NCGR_PEP_ID=MMETSP0367-20130122/39819_1 /TAXON_ID=447022 ORGANISM="Scrippsiella hangoei-like, Strain SHHI-4" /NCGR_SAMPLE_ID=MMETSP0367 /ASSEMBLY_ACC=CAM_ASM_000362 /LENGTH=45 /DNA_ID= /DNA_START= /DNA_END= /DNA_ORIENTATION=
MTGAYPMAAVCVAAVTLLLGAATVMGFRRAQPETIHIRHTIDVSE